LLLITPTHGCGPLFQVTALASKQKEKIAKGKRPKESVTGIMSAACFTTDGGI
jgi:hypothetical protein